MKLAAKLGVFSSLLVLLTVGGLSALFFMIQGKVLRAEMREKQVASLRGLAEVMQHAVARGDWNGISGYIALMSDARGLDYAEALWDSGRIVAHTDVEQLGREASDPGWEAASLAEDLLVQTYRKKDGAEVLDLVLPVRYQGRRAALVRTGYLTKELEAVLWESRRDTLLRLSFAAGAALLIGIAAALFIAQRIARPIREMARAASRIGGGNLDTQVSFRSADELGDLAGEINRMAARLQELDRMKRDFSSSVTHEIRTPLNSIGIYFDLLFQGRLGRLSEKQLEALRDMHAGVKRLQRFVDDLLESSRIDRGKFTISPMPLDLPPLIEETVGLLRVEAERNKQKLVSDTDDELPQVMADPDRTRQALMNLLSNALKYTPKGGRITVAAEPDGKMLRVSVRDTGEGIPKDSLRRVFEKFEQVRRRRKRGGEGPQGVGLGLSIVKGIVEAQGGTIWAESEVGRGSTFHFTVPLAKGGGEHDAT